MSGVTPFRANLKNRTDGALSRLPENFRDRRIKILAILLVVNAALTLFVMVWPFVLYLVVGNDPIIHLGLNAIPCAIATGWVSLTSTFAIMVCLGSMVSGRTRRAVLVVALSHAALLVPHAILTLSFQNIGGPFADRGVQFRRFSGTDFATNGSPTSKSALSVSPDEHWITYWEEQWEWTGKAPTSTWRLCSIDILNNTRIIHSVDSLRTLAKYSGTDWDDIAWGFDPGGWAAGRLYVDGIDFLAVIDPSRAQLLPCDHLPSDRAGPDAPNNGVIESVLRARNLPTENYEMERHSFIWSNYVKSNDLYFADYIEGDRYAIVHRNGNDSREILRKEGPFKLYSIDQVRVSPDQTFLAYSSFAHAKGHLSLPDYGTSVFIRHLPSGREKRVGRHFRVSNLIWSADGERLYYAGSGFDRFTDGVGVAKRGAGVYCVDVAATFPTGEYNRVPPEPIEPELTPAQALERKTRKWARYVDPNDGIAFRYPDSMTITNHGDAILLLSNNGSHGTAHCTNQRPDRFYAQIQMVHRGSDDLVNEFNPIFRNRLRTPDERERYGRAVHDEIAEPIAINFARGTRVWRADDCEYMYILHVTDDRSLVVKRIPAPRFDQEGLVTKLPELSKSWLPWNEDLTFAYILSTIEVDGQDPVEPLPDY